MEVKGNYMKKIKILYIEDDIITAKYTTTFLEDCGFSISHFESITPALVMLHEVKFEMLLLDLSLPDFHGFELIKKIRKRQTIPIIIMSAYSDVKTKVTAFRYGANDYMVKPIYLEELEARIWSILGMSSQIQEQTDEVLLLKENRLFFQEKALKLTQTEYDILLLLFKNKSQVLSREYLASSLSSMSSHRALDYHIKNIRKKMNDNSTHPKYLKTEYGVGYKLVL